MIQGYIENGFMKFSNFHLMMIKDKQGYVENMFKEYDLNSDGVITQDEMKTISAGMKCPIHAKKMKEFFNFMLSNFDANGDGEIDKQEFLDGVNSWLSSKQNKAPTNFHASEVSMWFSSSCFQKMLALLHHYTA